MFITSVSIPYDAAYIDRLVWSLLETFVYLDLARLTDMSADPIFKHLPLVDPWSHGITGPGHLAFGRLNNWFKDFIQVTSLQNSMPASLLPSSQFFMQMSPQRKAIRIGQGTFFPYSFNIFTSKTGGRLFFFRHGPSNSEPDRSAFNRNIDDCIAKVHISGHADANDLVSCLDAELKQVAPTESQPQVIVYPSDVVAFQLLHHSSGDRQKFSFPPYFYLDQFMHEKSQLANQKRLIKHSLLQKIASLEGSRKALTKFQVRKDAAPNYACNAEYPYRIATPLPIYGPRHTTTRT